MHVCLRTWRWVWLMVLGVGLLGCGIGCGHGDRVATSIPILMYHRISDDSPRDLWTLPVADFEAQLRYLKDQGYESILPDELVASIRQKKGLPHKPVMLTFDDGDLSVLTTAAPVLQRYGFRATAYIITGFLEREAETQGEFEGHSILTAEDIRTLNTKGLFAFGVHGHSHRRLTEMEDCLNEWIAAKNILRQKTGITATSAAYPFGAYNPFVVRQTRKAGFTTIMTCGEKVAGASHDVNLEKLPRLWIRGGNHHFEIRRLSVSVFEVYHQGITIPVAVRRVYPGIKAHEGWKTVAEISAGMHKWEWQEPVPMDGDTSLEIWDRNRFFRLYPPSVTAQKGAVHE